MKILITAGPTREPIDPVRYLSNRSSGKMGYALAEAALESGNEVVLVSGPVHLPAPVGAELIRIETAQEMYDAVAGAINSCEAAIFCAAVADYRVAEVEAEKIKKSADSLTLTLEKTPDILGSVREGFSFSGILVGFAAETNDVLLYAREKMEKKGCDLLVANDVSRGDIGFDQEENEVTLLSREGKQTLLPRDTKRNIAGRIVDAVEELYASRQ